MASPTRVLVAQIGARRHYAVARIFQQAGILGALHTDICSVKGWPRILRGTIPRSLQSSGMRRLFGRIPVGIPSRLIRTEDDLGWSYAFRRRWCKSSTEVTEVHLDITRAFGDRVARQGMRGFTHAYAFNTDAVEVLESARRAGLVGILDQTIPPRRTVIEMFEREQELFPELTPMDSIDHRWRELADRENREWELATTIVCGSPFVLEAMKSVGGPVDKAHIVPTGVEISRFRPPDRRRSGRAMNVLFVGEVGVRKGAHYLVEAAKRFGPNVQFRLCGQVRLPQAYVSQLPANVTLMGAVPRSEMLDQYAWADVFCLPSLLEGSAAVTYEAMAAGIPVITTQNTGSLVRDGIDGYIIPVRNVDALVHAMEKVERGELGESPPPLTDEPGGPPTYSLEAYERRLLQVVVPSPVEARSDKMTVLNGTQASPIPRESARIPCSPRRMLVVQLGARMHYAVPRIFHEAGRLGSLHTDVCGTKGWPAAMARVVPDGWRGASIRRILGRVPRGVPNDLIRTENDLGLRFTLHYRRCRTASQRTQSRIWAGEELCRRVVRRGIEPFDGLYLFSTEALEILERAKNLGIPTFLEQPIAARETVMAIYEQEHARFPDIVPEEGMDRCWKLIADRERAEWELADVIVCGSQFVLDTIREVGGPVEKAVIVNYGVDAKAFPPPKALVAGHRLTNVLFVGEVGFRKGSHYLLEAARQLPDFRFRFCGSPTLPSDYFKSAPANVEIMGIVPRVDMPKQYGWADIFCLPSLVEGSATVTYEALAVGLPILTTHQAGSIVRDGLDGYLIPPADSQAIVAGLKRLRDEGLSADPPPLVDRPGGPPSYTIEAYRDRLLSLIHADSSALQTTG
jgi:glycosyltransferase involved in cell wall biosynthesis